jgi:hypothetical protein
MFTFPVGLYGSSNVSIPNVPFNTWNLVSPVTSPSARCAADMAFYPGLGVVMVGGTLSPGGGAAVHDPYNVGQTTGAGTWVWTGTNWYLLAVATDSRGAFTGGMAYDSAANKLIRTCPYDAGNISQWAEFNGTNWTNFSAAPMGSQVWCKVAYDKVRAKTFLYGAWSGGGTWDYNSNTQIWTNTAAAGGTAGYGFSTCFDEYSGKVLNVNGSGGYRAQYYNGAWSSAGFPGVNPGLDNFTYGEAVWHPVRQTCIIKTLNETWEWNPATNTLSQMTLVNQGPTFSGYLAMAFDYNNGVMVMFGGQVGGGNISQTWVSGP